MYKIIMRHQEKEKRKSKMKELEFEKINRRIDYLNSKAYIVNHDKIQYIEDDSRKIYDSNSLGYTKPLCVMKKRSRT